MDSIFLKRLKASHKMKQKVMKLLAKKMSQTDIAAECGISKQRVHQIIKEMS